MKKTLLILAALAAPTLAVAQDGARPVTLADALALAKKNSPTMISARGSTRQNAASLRVAKWAFNPLNNLQLSYSSSTGGGTQFDSQGFLKERNSGWGFTQGFGSANLTIWDGGTKMGAIRSGKANVDASEASEVASEFSIAQQVKTQYYLILQALETEDYAKKTLDQAVFQLQLAKAKLNAGTATTADTLQAFVSMINARISILNAQNSRINANASLTRLAATPYPITAVVSDTSDPPALQFDENELFGLAERGPTVAQAVALYKVAQVNESVSKAIYWPQISATGGFSRSNSEPSRSNYDFGAGPMSQTWNFGLTATMTLFNGFTRENNIVRAKVSTDNAEASLRDAKFTARQNLTQQLGALRTAEETIRFQRLSIVAAEENLRVVTKRYELGSGVLLDVITAQNTLNSAHASLTSARVNARNARAQIEAIIGRDLPQ